MVQFDYDGIMKRYNVRVPFTLAGESSMVTIASISEDNRITLHRELSIKLLQQVLLNWDEYEHQITRELQEMLDEPKNDRLTYLEKRLQQTSIDNISVDEMELTVRTDNCLQSRGIRTIGELVKKNESELRKIKNFGRKSLTEIEVKLDELGLTLKQ